MSVYWSVIHLRVFGPFLWALACVASLPVNMRKQMDEKNTVQTHAANTWSAIPVASSTFMPTPSWLTCKKKTNVPPQKLDFARPSDTNDMYPSGQAGLTSCHALYSWSIFLFGGMRQRRTKSAASSHCPSDVGHEGWRRHKLLLRRNFQPCRKFDEATKSG